jgi:D-sedoheptulose 7-phosphate isomerase
MPESSNHSHAYFADAVKVAQSVDPALIDVLADSLVQLRDRGGRLFVLGVGGGAGHASHAVNDFRKLCRIESYAPTDNVSELTARTNDDGWDTSLVRWLEVSRFNANDAVFVFSVGGGSREHAVSINIVNAIEMAHDLGAGIYGVVGSAEGTLAKLADVAVILSPEPRFKTPLVEAFQAVVWHAVVSHPRLAVQQGHWESLSGTSVL